MRQIADSQRPLRVVILRLQEKAETREVQEMPTGSSRLAHHPSSNHAGHGTAASSDAARSLASLLSLLAIVASPSTSTAQAPNELPFDVGERMTYRVKVGKLGTG